MHQHLRPLTDADVAADGITRFDLLSGFKYLLNIKVDRATFLKTAFRIR